MIIDIAGVRDTGFDAVCVDSPDNIIIFLQKSQQISKKNLGIFD